MILNEDISVLMKLIAFVEDHKNGDYEVVQSALLQTDLADLPAPPASLTLNSADLDNQVYFPGQTISVSFDKISVDTVKVEFSTNGGTTWQTAGTTTAFKFYLTLPNIATDQGRVRISDLHNGSISSTEKKIFSIKQPDHSLSLHHPNGDDIVYLGQKFLIT